MPRRKKSEVLEASSKGAMRERITPSGRRNLMLTIKERKEFSRSEAIEHAVACYLNVSKTRMSETQMAEECGLTISAFKNMTRSDDFIELYSKNYEDLGHSPLLNPAKTMIGNMLIKSLGIFDELMSDADTPANTRFQMIKWAVEMNGLQAPKPVGSDKDELTNFLKDANVTQINNNTLVLPDGFHEKIHEYVDGSFVVPSMPEMPHET